MTANNKKRPQRIFDSPHSPIPEVQLLSNGRYHVMITSAGGGYSRWNSLAVTRWCEDTHTVIKLDGFEEGYRNLSPKTARTIADALLEHCLWYFVRGDGAPQIFVKDGEERISYQLGEASPCATSYLR